MNNKNKFHIIQLVIFITISFGVYKFYEKETAKKPSKRIVNRNTVNRIPTLKTSLPSTTTQRKVASIKSSAPEKSTAIRKLNGRDIIGRITDLKNIKFNNKIDKNWKKKYITAFTQMTFGTPVKNLKVELKRSVIKFNNNVGTYLEHIVVRYNQPDGKPFAFEALVDTQTSSTIQTWNQTRYEKRTPVAFDPSEHQFK